MEACDLLAVEHRLDRIEAELASELPPHMRAFARAHARGHATPPAPDVLRRPDTLATARAALVHPVLADRGLALARLVAPIAIAGDPAVIAAYAAPPSWDALAALAAARDRAAAAQLGRPAIALAHALHGVHALAARDPGDARGAPPALAPHADALAALPPRIAAWTEPDGPALDDHAISHAWDAIRARHGVDGAVRFERTGHARPRTFVVQPRGEVVVVIPARVAAPAERFAVLHELGHVLAALALPAGIPRVIDEAAAAYVARAMEHEAERGWFSPLAEAARTRRAALARVLDRIERALPEVPAAGDRIAERPPWALWHDPGAQAAYVAAEAIAEAMERALPHVAGATRPGALAAALEERREQIDQRSTGVS